MDFAPFYTRCPDLAMKETRTITVSTSESGIPIGEYGLIENYCTDKGCDCRRVIITVIEATPPHQTFATIGYGWESIEFYTQWMRGAQEIAMGMIGASLEPFGTQSQYVRYFLELFKAIALTDEYVSRLKTHYRIFKDHGQQYQRGYQQQRNKNKKKIRHSKQ